MPKLAIYLLGLSIVFLLPLLAACIIVWCEEALRLFHDAIKTRKFDDIAGFSVYMGVSCGLLAAIVMIFDKLI